MATLKLSRRFYKRRKRISELPAVVLTLGANTIIWHEDKRGKAADNGDLDLAAVAAAVWQQWPADSRKWWLSARWQGNSSETSAPHFLFPCKVRREAKALACGER